MSILIIGATRGLGASLARQYAQQGKTVHGTTRSSQGTGSSDFPDSVKWIPSIDLMREEAGDRIAGHLQGREPLDTVVRKRPFLRPEIIHVLQTSLTALTAAMPGLALLDRKRRLFWNRESRGRPEVGRRGADVHHELHCARLHRTPPAPGRASRIREQDRSSVVRVRKHHTPARGRGRRQLRPPCQQGSAEHGGEAPEPRLEAQGRDCVDRPPGIYADGNDKGGRV